MRNKIVGQLISLITNFVVGDIFEKDKEHKHECKTERRVETERDDRDEEYHSLEKGEKGSFIVKMKKEEGIDVETSKTNRTRSQLGGFIVSNTQRIVDQFVSTIDWVKITSVSNLDTASLCIDKKPSDILNKAGCVAEELGHGKMIVKVVLYFVLQFSHL